MRIKKSFTFLLILLISFGVMGVVSATITSIDLTAPDGGEYWSGTQDITWNAVGGDNDKVDILYNAGSGSVLIAAWQPYNAGSYSWDTAIVSDGSTYKIIVAYSSDYAINDISNGAFTIDNTLPTITDDYAYDGVWKNTAQTVTLTSQDTGGSSLKEVKYCEGTSCDLSSGTILSSPYQLDYSTSQDTIVRYQAFDNAENPSVIGEFNVKIDVDNPVVSVSGMPLDLVVDTSGMDAVVGCSDTGSGCAVLTYAFKFYATEQACSTTYADYTDTNPVPGYRWVCAAAKDDAGNEGYSSPIEFTIFDTIQDAIDAASDGDTINVAAGTYDGFKIEGKNSLIVQGSGNVIISGNPVIHTVDTNDYQVFVDVVDSTAITIDGLTLDASSIGGTHFKAIYYSESSGTIQNNTIQNIDIGGQKSSAIWVSSTADISILDNTIDEFGKGGIVVYGASSIQIEGNTIITTDHSIAPNGIQVGYLLPSLYPPALDITGTISGNNVSGASWEGYDSGKGYDGDTWTGAGILIMDITADLEISDNTLHSNDVGIDIEAGSLTTIQSNEIYNNAYGIVSWNEDPSINYNNIENNDEYGLFRTSMGTGTGILNAINNWWGHITGPSSVGPGDGDSVSANVNFDPWWVTEIGGNDVTPPESEITLSGTLYYNTGTFDLPYTALDDYGLKRVRLYENGPGSVTDFDSLPTYPISHSGTFTRIGLIDETYTYYTVAVDIRDTGFGGAEDAPATADVTIIVDTTDPVVTIDTITSPTSATTITVTGTFTEDNINTITVNGITATLGAGTYSAANVPLTEGSNTITVIATDKAGNTDEEITNVELDIKGPSITHTQTIIGRAVDETTEISATVTDSNGVIGATLHYTVDGVPGSVLMTNVKDIYSATIPASTEEGEVTYYIIGEDGIGNEARNPASGSYTILVNDLVWKLDSPWNLVSVPKTLVDDSVPNNVMWYYNPTESNPLLRWKNPTIINPGVGYWVENTPLTILGLDYSGDCGPPFCLPSGNVNIDALENGWNLIGLTTTDTTTTVGTAFSSEIFPDESLPVFYVIS